MQSESFCSLSGCFKLHTVVHVHRLPVKLSRRPLGGELLRIWPHQRPAMLCNSLCCPFNALFRDAETKNLIEIFFWMGAWERGKREVLAPKAFCSNLLSVIWLQFRRLLDHAGARSASSQKQVGDSLLVTIVPSVTEPKKPKLASRCPTS